MSIRRNTIYNLLGSVIPLSVSLITIPIYIRLITESRYGVLAIIWLLLGYFGLFDLGLGRATAQRIAVLRTSSVSERAKTFWTALLLNGGLGVIGGFIAWPVASYFFRHVFMLEVDLLPEVQHALPWLVLAVPMATVSGVLSGALQGQERFLELNIISIISTILFQVFPLLVASVWGPYLGFLFPSAILARIFSLIVLFTLCRRFVFGGVRIHFDSMQSSQLLRFGGWVTITSFVSPMMVMLDRFVIGTLSGPVAVSHYTVPFQLSQRSTIISDSLASALFPRFASTSPKERLRLAQEGVHLIVIVMTPLIGIGILIMEPFLSWWLTPEFASQSALAGQVVLLGFWVNSFGRIVFAQLQAQGRPDLIAKCHLGELLPYLVLLFFFLKNFGLVGAAAVFSLRVFADFFLLANFVGILRVSLRLMFVPILLLSIAFLIALLTIPFEIEWLVLVLTHLIVSLIWSLRQISIPLRKINPSFFEKFSKTKCRG